MDLNPKMAGNIIKLLSEFNATLKVNPIIELQAEDLSEEAIHGLLVMAVATLTHIKNHKDKADRNLDILRGKARALMRQCALALDIPRNAEIPKEIGEAYFTAKDISIWSAVYHAVIGSKQEHIVGMHEGPERLPEQREIFTQPELGLQ